MGYLPINITKMEILDHLDTIIVLERIGFKSATNMAVLVKNPSIPNSPHYSKSTL